MQYCNALLLKVTFPNTDSDHLIKTVNQTCGLRHYCRIQYSRTASSFSFNLSENPLSNCHLFVNEFVVKKGPSSY